MGAAEVTGRGQTMGNQRAFDVKERLADDGSELFEDVGVPDFNRRLTDKILSAFNHAYSVGEAEIAEQLRAILINAEGKARGDKPARQTGYAARQAELWMKFVEARGRYRPLAQAESIDALAISTALDEMKEAYKDWSMN